MRHLRVCGSFRTLALTALMLWLCILPANAAQRSELARRVDHILARADVARGFWGIEIEELDSGRVIYSHDAQRLFTPASNTKLFTTAAALALIGPDYRIRTTAESATSPDKYGRLSGDLVLVGRGDPNLSGRALPYALKTQRPLAPDHVLEEIADQVAAHGVKVIDGDVVADDTFFVYEPYGEGWSQGDLMWQYGAPVSALAINDNVVDVNILPAARVGERAFVTIAPFAGYYHLENRVVTSPAGAGPRKISIQRQPGSTRLEIWGNIPLDDPGPLRNWPSKSQPSSARACSRSCWPGAASFSMATRARHLTPADLASRSVAAARSPARRQSRTTPGAAGGA